MHIHDTRRDVPYALIGATMPTYPEEFTTISVGLARDDDALLLIPQDVVATAMLERILDSAPEALVWSSHGVSVSRTDRLTHVFFSCGGTSYWRTQATKAGGTISGYDYRDAIKVCLELADNTNPNDASKLRGLAWAGVRVDPVSTIETFALVPTVTCKLCNLSLIKPEELQWRVCNACVAVCQHDYVEGPGNYHGQLVRMPFCRVCGRADPDWRPSENPAEDMLQVVAKGDIDALVLRNADDITVITRKQ